MIQLNCAMLQEDFKTAVLAINPDIKFIKKVGMGLQFETPNDAEFQVLIKKALKSDSKFKALYFNINIK